MKYIMYTSILSGGGAERVLVQLANHFSMNNKVILVASYKTANEYEINRNVEIRYLDSDIYKKNSFKQIIRLRSIVKNEEPDLCLSFLPQPNFKMILATRFLDVKTIVSVRNDPKREYQNIFDRLLMKILYPLSDGIVLQTRDSKKYFSKKIQKKSQVIMNQVDEIFFKTPHVSEDYWIATGRLTEQKNYNLMLCSFKEVVKKHPNEILKIYGNGSLEKKLKEQIIQLGLSNNVFLMGQTYNIANALSHAKGFLLTSNYEGMPNGLLEALAMGIPCISTDCPCGGPREIIINRHNGFLVKINDKKAMVASMFEIIENKNIKEEISINARVSSFKFYPQEILNEWISFFESRLKE